MMRRARVSACFGRRFGELGRIDYEEAAQHIFAAQEWVQSQDWSKAEEPSPVQVALNKNVAMIAETYRAIYEATTIIY